MDLDDAGERLDAEVGEPHDAVVAWTVDPDKAVLLVHLGCHVPQPFLILPQHLGDAGNGVDVVDLVDRSQAQAATAATTDAFAQFQGRNSSSR